MKYQLVVATDYAKLEEAVNRLCKQQWRPYGNLVAVVCVNQCGDIRQDTYELVQPMVLED